MPGSFNKQPAADSAVEEFSSDMSQGYQVDVRKLLHLHPNITHIRFHNSW